MNTQGIIEKCILYKDLTVYYYVKGDSNKPSIVLLHPAFGNHKIFDKQFALADDYYVIAVDMVSHGNSQNHKSKVTMGDMPEIIAHILTVESVAQAHIIGVSLGSLVAQSIAHKHPEMVKSVTVVGGYSIHKDNSTLLKTQQKEIFKWFFYILFSLSRFKQYIIDNSCHNQASRNALEESLSTFKRRQLRGMSGMNRLFYQTEAPIAYPLLIIAGEHDLPLLLKNNQEWAKGEKLSKTEIIPNAGHCANIDNPKVFNHILSSFIDTVLAQ